MKIMPPAFEVIAPSFGSSFAFSKYVENANSKSHVWHYHPEIELVYVNGGSGKRMIGSHVSYYTDGDLILIGKSFATLWIYERANRQQKRDGDSDET